MTIPVFVYRYGRSLLPLLLFILAAHTALAQPPETRPPSDPNKPKAILANDSTYRINKTSDSLRAIKDSIKKAKADTAKAHHSPRKAALRSAILPGWGQIYNKKYWKLPIVYGALGVSGGVFFYNLTNYRNTRFAYRVKYNMRANKTDSALFVKIKKDLQPLSEESLRFYRDQFRRDIDYSALFFIILWGLNVVDATVDGHLKSFDVSPDLSLRIKPGHSDMANTNGLSLVLAFKDKSSKRLLPSRF